MYNILSFGLGIGAWALGIAAICSSKHPWFCVGSLSACGLSLLLQLMEVLRRVNLQDWTALMDTMDAVVTAAKILLTVTLALNIAACLRKTKSPR